MKIIMSVAGGGKSRKATKLASQYAAEGKNVHIIFSEVDRDFYVEEMFEQGYNLNVIKSIKYTSVSSIKEALEAIKNDNSDVVVLDDVVTSWHLNDIGFASDEAKNELLNTLYDIEKESNRKFYVTQQAKLNDVRLNGEDLIIFDYEAA